jgi:hypothetical protein
MVKSVGRVSQSSRQVFHLKVRHLPKDFLSTEPGRKKIKDVDNPNPHTADAGTATALLGIDRDALLRISHSELLVWR